MSVSFDLWGKVAVVTGASDGIGRALAVGLAEAGADVAVHFFDDAEGARRTAGTIEALGRRAMLVAADNREVAQIARLFDEVASTLGGTDVLVNNAGLTGWSAALEVDEALWDRVIDTNLKGTFFCSTHAARQMKTRGGGSIINVSSVVGLRATPNLTAYAASKAGIHALTRQMAVELAPMGIRVNAFAPGPTVVPRTVADDPDYAENWARVVPLGRTQVPLDMVGPCIFLASGAAAMVTGQIIAVDGGVTLPQVVPQVSLDRSLAKHRGE